MSNKERVVVAMSGGVDSSVAAGLLVEQGYDVIGMMLRLWSEPGTELFNRCCTPQSMALARRVASKLGIPFYVQDVRDTFKEKIVQFFIDGYTRGETPNPCMMCNRHIRFGALLDRSRAFGAKYLATGHYARTRRENDRYELLRGIDRSKDQSYVLSVLNQEQLSHAMFPIGEYPKDVVRQMAARMDLPTADRSDSQDLCFLAGGDYRDFLVRHAPEVEAPGWIVNPEGDRLGRHSGLAFHTIGQRKGLGIQTSVPLYVLEKDVENNTIVVGERGRLGMDYLVAEEVNWISGAPPAEPFRAEVKIRYTAREAGCTVYPLDENHFEVILDNVQPDITPGQSAVLFDGERVVGGGIIRKARRSEDGEIK